MKEINLYLSKDYEVNMLQLIIMMLKLNYNLVIYLTLFSFYLKYLISELPM